MGDLTVSGLARAAGLDLKTVRAIRDNTATRVDLSTLDALAVALGCAAGDLLAGPSGYRPAPSRPKGRRP